MSRVVFLDIDGVFCTNRTMILEHSWEWDSVGIRMLNKLLEKYDYQIVMSSTWRLNTGAVGAAMMLRSHGFKNIHRDTFTPDLNLRNRGYEIQSWLEDHPEVTHYAILDDDSDMLEEQKPYFVQTDIHNGFLYEHYTHLESLMKRAYPMGQTP